MSFLARLRQEIEAAATGTIDPWWLALERVRGKIGDDGLERVTTQLLFDILEVPQRSIEGPARVAVWRSSWRSLGGWPCGCGVSRVGTIWNKCVVIVVNHSVAPDQQERVRHCADL